MIILLLLIALARPLFIIALYEPIGPGDIVINLPHDWKLEKHVLFESEYYVAWRDSDRAMSIYLGNRPDTKALMKTPHIVAYINGEHALEFYAGSKLQSVLITTQCGQDQYVLMSRLSEAPAVLKAFRGVAQSVRCNVR